MKKSYLITEKIYWRSLPKNCKLRFDSNSFYFEGSLIFWHGHEQEESIRFLKTRIRS